MGIAIAAAVGFILGLVVRNRLLARIYVQLIRVGAAVDALVKLVGLAVQEFQKSNALRSAQKAEGLYGKN
jgi:hypothetical protein